MATQSSAPGVPQIEHHKLAQRLLVKATSTPPREAKRSRRASMVVHGSPTMSKQAVVDKAFQELCTPERKSAEGWLEGGREQRVSVGQLVVLLTPPEGSLDRMGFEMCALFLDLIWSLFAPLLLVRIQTASVNDIPLVTHPDVLLQTEEAIDLAILLCAFRSTTFLFTNLQPFVLHRRA